MNILVTGGAGYIGSHTAVELLDNGYDVVLIDNFSNSTPETLERIREVSGKDFQFYEMDLLDIEGLETVFQKETIDAIIHFAGFKAVGESVQMPLAYYQNNLVGTLNVLKVMEKYQVSPFIFSSSATVYGTEHTPPFTEDLSIGANNPYGHTKVIVEKMLQDIAAVTPEFSAVSLRYFNPIGAHPSGKLGEAPKGTPHNLMPYISEVALGKRSHVTVYGDDYDTLDGTNVRDYIHVVDVARGHLEALNFALKHRGAHAFNLGTGRGYSVLEVIHTYEKVNGVAIPYEIATRRPGDIDTSYADVGKARDILNWSAEYALEDMCRTEWVWQQHRLGESSD